MCAFSGALNVSAYGICLVDDDVKRGSLDFYDVAYWHIPIGGQHVLLTRQLTLVAIFIHLDC